MKKIDIKNTRISLPNIIAGCMRYSDKSVREVRDLIYTALENGMNLFDHADVYGGNHSAEKIFAKACDMSSSIREKFILQTKCGIAVEKDNVYYDFSYDHIIKSVDGSLKALNTEYIDILLLHRPDTLVRPCEVNRAFEKLYKEGKVRLFGVSNQTPMLIELLKHNLNYPILFNQLELSAAHTLMFDHQFSMNINNTEQSISRTSEVLEYCRLNDITIQAWSPFQKGFFEGLFIDDPDYVELNDTLKKIAKQYGVTPSAIAVAFITSHPANMQVILGTTNKQRLLDCAKGSDIPLTHKQWYDIYKAGNKILP